MCVCVWGGVCECVNELCVKVTGYEVGVCGVCGGGRGKCVRPRI